MCDKFELEIESLTSLTNRLSKDSTLLCSVIKSFLSEYNNRTEFDEYLYRLSISTIYVLFILTQDNIVTANIALESNYKRLDF